MKIKFWLFYTVAVSVFFILSINPAYAESDQPEKGELWRKFGSIIAEVQGKPLKDILEDPVLMKALNLEKEVPLNGAEENFHLNSEASLHKTVFDSVSVDELRERMKKNFIDGHLNAQVGDELLPGKTVSIVAMIAVGLDRNAMIKRAEEDIIQSSAQYKAIRANLNPTLTLDAMATKQGPSTELSLPAPFNQKFVFSRDYNYIGQLTLQKLLTTFGKVENQVASAFINIRAMQEVYLNRRNELTLEIKKACYNILKTQALVVVADDFKKSAQDQLKVALSLYNNGIVSRFDAVKAQLAVSQAEQELVSAKKNLILARANLLTLLEFRERFPYFVSPNEMKALKQDVSLDPLQRIALENRNDLQAMRENILSARKLLDSAYADNNPLVTLSARYKEQTATAIMDNYSWDVGLAIQIPILDGGTKYAKVQDSSSVLRSGEIALENLENRICFEVEQGFYGVREMEIIYRTAVDNQKTAEEEYRMATVRYKNGLSLAVEMDDSLRTLNRAKQERVMALFDYQVALATLEMAMGRDLDKEQMIPFHEVMDDEK